MAKFAVSKNGSGRSRKGRTTHHLLLLLSLGSHTPPPRVGVSLHDAPLDLGDDAVVARREVHGRHERNTERNGLSLGGHEDNLLVDLDVGLVPEQTGDHELGSVADGVDGRVLDDQPLVAGKERLERSDDSSEVRLCAELNRRTSQSTKHSREC